MYSLADVFKIIYYFSIYLFYFLLLKFYDTLMANIIIKKKERMGVRSRIL